MRPPCSETVPVRLGVSMSMRGTSAGVAAAGPASVAASLGPVSARGVPAIGASDCVSVAGAFGSVGVGSGGGNITNQTRITRKLSAVASSRFLFWSSIALTYPSLMLRGFNRGKPQRSSGFRAQGRGVSGGRVARVALFSGRMRSRPVRQPALVRPRRRALRPPPRGCRRSSRAPCARPAASRAGGRWPR